jgi:hypothetical protein
MSELVKEGKVKYIGLSETDFGMRQNETLSQTHGRENVTASGKSPVTFHDLYGDIQQFDMEGCLCLLSVGRNPSATVLFGNNILPRQFFQVGIG